MAGYGAPANLVPFKPGNSAARRAPWPEKALRAARRACPEAVGIALQCMRDPEVPWNDRLAAIKIILGEGLPKKRDAFEALFAAAASGEGFIEVRFVAPGSPTAVIEARAGNGHDPLPGTFSINLDDC